MINKKSYKDLLVWQKAIDLTVEVYRIVKKLPKEELYALSGQIRRAVVSIPSNISEGQSRNSQKEFMHFLSIAKGSKSELETQIYICKKIGYLSDEDIEKTMGLMEEVGKMLNSLINTLRTNN